MKEFKKLGKREWPEPFGSQLRHLHFTHSRQEARRARQEKRERREKI